MQIDDKTISNFVSSLPNIKFDDCQNPWIYKEQRTNFEMFLKKYKSSKYILIGEAPGRRGCLQSGVPFCDCHTLLEFLDKKDEKNTGKFLKESSAQKIFKVFPCGFIAWNVFPIQPCKKNGENRTPRSNELENGESFLFKFLDIFLIEGKDIILVGSMAKKYESKIRKKYQSVKIKHIIHPSPRASNHWKIMGYESWEQYVKKVLNE